VETGGYCYPSLERLFKRGMMDNGEDNQIVQEFLIESYENLDNLDCELVTLESNPTDTKSLASIFRMIHTIKGTCGFLGFGKLEKVAHVGENLLSRLRDGELKLTPEMTTALLRTGDAIRQMLASIEASGAEGERNDAELIAVLTQLQSGGSASAPTAASVDSASSATVSAASVEAAPIAQPESQPAEKPQQEMLPSTKETIGAVPVAEQSTAAAPGADSGDNANLPGAKSQASESTIRVDVGLLDKLMNLVGELVLTRNQILQFTNSINNNGLLATSQRLNLITTELQEGVMKTRMQPIGNIWTKFPRTVRDVATSCGKQVRIEMEGRETELDKTIVEAIKDPLTHMVRNAVDHGVEKPEMRRAAGKPVEGRVLLRAYHEGGKVNIEIADDGAGLNFEKLRAKAVKRGLITQEQAERMSDREAVNLIFHPGLSTAEQISNVSGRGVGMDVVKTNIEKIGGTVDVSSVPGAGTTVRMKIPLTLAIISALVVTSAGNCYAIPQVSLLELVRLKAGQVESKIERIQGNHFYRLRGRLLPLVYLRHELQRGDTKESFAFRAMNIVVLQADERQFGLVVDEINDTEEIVVKPLGKQIKGVSTFAGATIMGDGKVALILDVLGLAQRAGVIGRERERASADDSAAAASAAKANARQTLLLFQESHGERMAIPLSLIARLEEFPRESVERAGDQEVAQYRGRILPLLRISDYLKRYRNGSGVQSHGIAPPTAGAGNIRGGATEKLQVVVLRQGDHSIGLIVHRILDIVEQEIALEHPSRNEGVRGSAVVQNKVTDLLDVEELLNGHNHLLEEELVGSGGRR
jgi:two-component system chemotaxis sensor kinase CheA